MFLWIIANLCPENDVVKASNDCHSECHSECHSDSSLISLLIFEFYLNVFEIYYSVFRTIYQPEWVSFCFHKSEQLFHCGRYVY